MGANTTIQVVAAAKNMEAMDTSTITITIMAPVAVEAATPDWTTIIWVTVTIPAAGAVVMVEITTEAPTAATMGHPATAAAKITTTTTSLWALTTT